MPPITMDVFFGLFVFPLFFSPCIVHYVGCGQLLLEKEGESMAWLAGPGSVIVVKTFNAHHGD